MLRLTASFARFDSNNISIVHSSNDNSKPKTYKLKLRVGYDIEREAEPSLSGGRAERVFTHIFNNLDRAHFEPFLARGAYLELVKADVSTYNLKAERARNAIPPLLKLIWRLRPRTVASTVGMNFASDFQRVFKGNY